jgi:cytoskeletal protein RodZ
MRLLEQEEEIDDTASDTAETEDSSMDTTTLDRVQQPDAAATTGDLEASDLEIEHTSPEARKAAEERAAAAALAAVQAASTAAAATKRERERASCHHRTLDGGGTGRHHRACCRRPGGFGCTSRPGRLRSIQ